MIGTKLAHYEITAHLGSGGMGDVYQATDSKLGRSVAIKLLPEAFTHDADRAARFEREARMLASLNHPNIAAIYGIEQSGDRKFLVMELVPGETLAERIRRGPISVKAALEIAKQIAEALEAAHDSEKAIIHRDLKPANVKVTPDGKVKVLDFGLAKAFEAEGSKANLSQSPTLSMAATNAGMILGTAGYMSPEQAKGMNVDRRSDIFSFGALLYEMLTGRQAFPGDTVGDILAAVIRAEPDWTRLPADVSPAFRMLLRLCLEKDLKKRRRDAGDLRIDIEQALTEPRETAAGTADRMPRRDRLGWIVAAVFLIGLAALVCPALRRFRETLPDTPKIRSTILPPENTTLDFTNGLGLPALSPDGRRIVFGARTARGVTPLWVRSLDGLAAQPLAGTEGATFPFWSSDSRFIAFFADGKLKKIYTSGGPILTLADAPVGRGGTWNRDVIVFAPTNGPGLMQVSSTGGAAKPIMTVQGSLPWFLPDGQHFLYQDLGGGTLSGEVPFRVGSLDGSQSKVLGAGSNVLYAQGHILFLLQGNLINRVNRVVVRCMSGPLQRGPANGKSRRPEASRRDGAMMAKSCSLSRQTDR